MEPSRHSQNGGYPTYYEPLSLHLVHVFRSDSHSSQWILSQHLFFIFCSTRKSFEQPGLSGIQIAILSCSQKPLKFLLLRLLLLYKYFRVKNYLGGRDSEASSFCFLHRLRKY